MRGSNRIIKSIQKVQRSIDRIIRAQGYHMLTNASPFKEALEQNLS